MMGNWMTVSLRGSLASEDVPAAQEFVNCGPNYENFHCLSDTHALCSLGNWPGREIHADGNLAERGYSVEDIADTLRNLVKVAPSLSLKVHCGGDYESVTCVTTVSVAGGVVTVGDPEVDEVGGVSEDVFKGRLFDALHRRGEQS